MLNNKSKVHSCGKVCRGKKVNNDKKKEKLYLKIMIIIMKQNHALIQKNY